jgi:NADH-quinone oxidoreductase subunit J
MTILFILAAAVVVVGALVTVLARDLVRAVLALGAMLAGTAMLYGLLDAPYLAAVQLLLYVGGVVTVLVFGVLLTRRPEGGTVEIARGRTWPALVAALAFAGVVAAAILRAPFVPPGDVAESTASVGARFLTEHVLAFEVLSLVLLAAMVGAIALARKERP